MPMRTHRKYVDGGGPLAEKPMNLRKSRLIQPNKGKNSWWLIVENYGITKPERFS